MYLCQSILTQYIHISSIVHRVVHKTFIMLRNKIPLLTKNELISNSCNLVFKLKSSGFVLLCSILCTSYTYTSHHTHDNVPDSLSHIAMQPCTNCHNTWYCLKLVCCRTTMAEPNCCVTKWLLSLWGPSFSRVSIVDWRFLGTWSCSTSPWVNTLHIGFTMCICMFSLFVCFVCPLPLIASGRKLCTVRPWGLQLL